MKPTDFIVPLFDSAAIRSRSAHPGPNHQRRFSAGGGGREIAANS